VRSDDGGEFLGGSFGALCRDFRVRQEHTCADTPQLKGVAERGLGLIASAKLAGRLQASELFGHVVNIPSHEDLWAEASAWACAALNATATTANPGSISPYEAFYGKPAPLQVLPFLKPAFHRKAGRRLKSGPKGVECFYLGPGRNHSSTAMRVLLLDPCRVVTSQNVIFRHIPAQTVS
ncbi:unnamed protein product, partial [Discosporangium mesarthrocarpum]